jgi:hypothetical protein
MNGGTPAPVYSVDGQRLTSTNQKRQTAPKWIQLASHQLERRQHIPNWTAAHRTPSHFWARGNRPKLKMGKWPLDWIQPSHFGPKLKNGQMTLGLDSAGFFGAHGTHFLFFGPGGIAHRRAIRVHLLLSWQQLASCKTLSVFNFKIHYKITALHYTITPSLCRGVNVLFRVVVVISCTSKFLPFVPSICVSASGCGHADASLPIVCFGSRLFLHSCKRWHNEIAEITTIWVPASVEMKMCLLNPDRQS